MKTASTPKIDASALLEAVSKICLGLPETSTEESHGHASFRARKKVFAYFLADHHGDGIIAVCFKGALGEQDDLIAMNPKLYYKPAYIGPRGWIGLRLDQGKPNWKLAERHMRASYILCAPKTLVAQLPSAN